MCVRCCQRFGDRSCRVADETSQCDLAEEECDAYNDDICGIQYSDPEQAFFCEIDDPIVWPPAVDIPTVGQRAGRWRPDVVIFTNADENRVENQLRQRIIRDIVPVQTTDDQVRPL